jgi:hypothetical protein
MYDREAENQRPTGGSPWDPYNAKIQAGYQQYLGRSASEDELRLHHGGNPNGWEDQNLQNSALYNIQNSDEAKAYASRTPTVTTTTDKKPPAVVTEERRGPIGGGAAEQAAPAFQPASGGAMQQTAATATAPKQNPLTGQITDILRQRLANLSNPDNLASDPIYQAQIREAQLASLRGADRQRASRAERMAADGTRSSGGFNTGVQGILENQRESDRGFAAGLSGQRLNAREQQLNEAIQMARAIGQDDIAAQFELERLKLQQELGRGDLSLRGELGRGQLGLGYDQLGYSYADMINRANRDAVLAAL